MRGLWGVGVGVPCLHGVRTHPGRQRWCGVNPSKKIGTATETAIKDAAHRNGFPLADRLALSGALDRGDVLLAPGLMVEAKGGKQAEKASRGQIMEWLVETETERQNARADLAFLVTKRKGVSAKRAELWFAHFTFESWSVLTADHSWSDTLPPVLRDEPLTIQLRPAFQLCRLAGWGEPYAQ